jgi:hypothetical protein
MAKKQTRRSISVSRLTYERLKAFCEANHVSMSQLVETRVNDFLGGDSAADTAHPAAPRPPVPIAPSPPTPPSSGIGSTAGSGLGTSFGSPLRPSMPAPARPPIEARPAVPAPVVTVPMTSAAARIAIEPPPPIIKPKQETAAPKPAEKRPDQIFTF